MNVIFNDFPSVRCPRGCYSNIPPALFSTSFFGKCNPLTSHYHFIKRMTSKPFIKVPSSLHLRKHRAIFCWQSQHLEILPSLFNFHGFHLQPRNDANVSLFHYCKIYPRATMTQASIKSVCLTKKSTKMLKLSHVNQYNLRSY